MDFKAALTSKTLWGIVMMAAPTAWKMATGHDLSPADASGMVSAVQQTVNDALSVGGLVLATWGRATAKGPLVKPVAP